MKILYAGYRDWALKTHSTLSQMSNVQFDLVTDMDSLHRNLENYKYDAIILVGWSWIVNEKLCNENYIVGVHPSDLPHYAGGTPLQHQIINGIVDTKCSLFRVTPNVDAGAVVGKVNLSLAGNMTDIFRNLGYASLHLIRNFIIDWEKFNGPPPELEQDHNDCIPWVRKRLKPEDGEIDIYSGFPPTAKKLYNLIRCREDPYPNAFIRDGTGTLRFKLVEFDENDKSIIPEDS